MTRGKRWGKQFVGDIALGLSDNASKRMWRGRVTTTNTPAAAKGRHSCKNSRDSFGGPPGLVYHQSGGEFSE